MLIGVFATCQAYTLIHSKIDGVGVGSIKKIAWEIITVVESSHLK